LLAGAAGLYDRAMDKQDLVAQLVRQLQATARAALSARDAVASEAREGATPDEKREDARAAHQLGTLGKAQQKRAQQALAEVDAVAKWKPARMTAVAVGAIIEIEDPDSGEGRTLFLAPVGAGMTLTGPGGDGLLSVVTPASPVGKAMLGRKEGELVEIAEREWQISYVG
jgi:transcription elongation GreA/GreB family factor